MDSERVHSGMMVECQQGIARVLVKDKKNNMVLIETQDTNEQLAVHCDDLQENLQLHSGCDRYY
ncbi:hypothetical protein [Vibrio agarivorans]|uniref:hypothetical protein n=1 Tax=Vibrio agarivorans TaxID=153622 RepID=UPI0022306C3F|nr:hypothetical protein [Vibrio agarivorans]MDN3661652.1 hypothetical protein [Vibrio agarivorans]